MKLINANVVIPGGVIENGVIIIKNGKIVYAGSEEAAPAGSFRIYDAKGLIAGPGFVDIHCHGGGKWWAHENPAGTALHHLKGGTTSLLCSFWRNAVNDGIEKAVSLVKEAVQNSNPGNIRGIHMEGPYLNSAYGSEKGREYPVDPQQYTRWMNIAGDIIKYWTFDPEQNGAEDFAKACRDRGIVLGICYSNAFPELISQFRQYGLNIGTHIMCGTGAPPTRFEGTKEPGSDAYVLANEEMYAEVIADSVGAHIRPLFIELIYKLKGPGRIIIITDCCTGGDSMGSDVNIINGTLYGSRLTMNTACANMKKYTGASIWEIFQMACENPARAIGIFDRYGSIEAGKAADIVLVDEDFNVQKIILSGKFVE